MPVFLGCSYFTDSWKDTISKEERLDESECGRLEFLLKAEKKNTFVRTPGWLTEIVMSVL